VHRGKAEARDVSVSTRPNRRDVAVSLVRNPVVRLGSRTGYCPAPPKRRIFDRLAACPIAA
jgi:hypothetical protein